VLAGLAPFAWQNSQNGNSPAVGTGVNAKYLEAVDLLDHAYRPGAAEKAIALLEPVASAPGATALMHAALGRAYFRQFRVTRDGAWLEKATATGERAVALDGKLAAARVVLGRVYTYSGKSDLAAQELQAAIQLDARNADAYIALAELSEKQGRPTEVEMNLQKAVDLAPDYWSGHASLGIHFRDTNRPEKARQEFQRLIELAPDNASAHEYLGILDTQQDRFEDARKAFEKAINLAPDFRTFTNLGYVLRMEGNFNESAKVFRKAIALNPRDNNSWGNLGAALAQMPEHKAEAMDAYRKAIAYGEESRKATPNDHRLLARLGLFYARLGDAKKSIPFLRQAIALDGETAETAYRAGEAYEVLGQRDEALRWVGIAMKRGYSPEQIKRTPSLALLRKDPRFTWTQK